MRYIVGFLFLFFIFTSLEAEYLRSIRIASAHTEADAEKILAEVNIFSQVNNLDILQDEHSFEYKVIKVDNYYRVVVEPLDDRELVQLMLDTLRTEYKDSYPKKIFRRKQVDQKSNVAVEKKIIKKVILEEMEREEESPEKEIEIVETERIEPSKPVELHNEEVIVKEESITVQNSTNIWKILSVILFILFMVLVTFMILLRRKNELQSNREIINHEKINQLEEQMQKKEKLLSHVSHELRTPMTAIMGLTHIVLEGELTRQQKENVVRIEGSAQHLLSIINDILDVSKMQAGKLNIEKSEFNINHTIDYVLNIISIQAKNNNIDISIDMAKDIPSHLIGDSLRVGQILVNLLGNSVKFTKDGEISLGVKMLSSFNDSVKLEFSVSDTGIGMTSSQIENIFKSYSQAEGSTSRKFGGTGLGLSISKQLVEMMNGEIKVQSQKDVGTTFTFTIVFKLKDSQNQRQYRLPSSTFLNKRVLIVDSTNKNIIAITKSLEYFKYNIETISSFEELILNENIYFDIVIINEEKLDKLALEKITSLENMHKLKIVVLNKLYFNVENEFIKDLHVDTYLRVPFTQQSILNMLIELYVSKNLDSKSRKKSIKSRLKEMAGKKILIAEDNEVNHKVISGLLGGSGIEITFVKNGQSAVDLVHKGMHFDMVLMDINMPIMNGYEASIEIRKDKKYNKMPILALTADVMDDAVEKAFNSGMQGHIAKPIIVDIFYQKILETLKLPEIEIKMNNIAEKPKGSSENEYEELSISTGLGRCNNDTEFYKSILRDFKIMYFSSPDTLSKMCNDSNFKDARKMAMDIKDVALNIGAYNLCESAANMEYEFEKGSRSDFVKLVEFYEIGLKNLFLDIDLYLEKE